MLDEKVNQVPISVIIPAYNEEHAIQFQLETICQVLDKSGISYEIIVIDDGSIDRTGQLAQKAGARLFRHSENRGYGAALKTGILCATHDSIVIIDGDGTYPADQIPHLVELLGRADMVVGARVGEQVHNSWLRRPAKWFLRMLATWIAEQPIPDLNSGLRAFRKECIKQYLALLPNRFSFTSTVTLAFIVDNYRVIYHPIDYYPRLGISKIVPWHFMDFLMLIIRMSMMFNPLKVFLPLALISGMLGLLKTLYDVIALFARNPGSGWELLMQPALSTSAVLLLFISLQFLMIGMMADGIIRRIAQFNRPLVPSKGYISYEVVEDKKPLDENQVK